MKYEEILHSIRQRKFQPLYFLFGDEAYFIDKIMELLEEQVVPTEFKSFNQDTLYGEDVTANKLISLAKGFPMMAERRLILIKEAHRIKKDELERLTSYIEKPIPSTIIAFAYKSNKKPDGRLKFSKALTSNALMFESKPLYDNQIPSWIMEYLKPKGIGIEPQALQVMVSYLGANLHIIENELSKILIHLQAKKENLITQSIVFDMVNIDKDYNVFELIENIGIKDVYKSHLVIDQMMKNTKNNPGVLIVFQLFKYFNELTLLKFLKIENEQAIAAELRIHPFVAKKYRVAVQNFHFTRLKQNLIYIQEADLSLKGISNSRMGEEHILKTLIYKLLQ